MSDQHARFREAAHQLECDENKAAFNEKLKGIALVKAKHVSRKFGDAPIIEEP